MATSLDESQTFISEVKSIQKDSFLAWKTFVQKRFPLATYVILVAGFSLSGSYLAGANSTSLGITMTGLALMLFFFELRLMDELKDYQKDQVAHRDRPLPQGLISIESARSWVVRLFLAMIATSVAIGILFNPQAGSLFLGITLYLWLMYEEFYIGESLSQFPFVYALTHQIILIPICLFATAVHRPVLLRTSPELLYGCLVFSAFFAYEICRKLDPKSHPILKTYRQHYGLKITALVTGSLVLLSIILAWQFQMAFLWPAQFALLFSLVGMSLGLHGHKMVEFLATFSLAVHIWSIPVGMAILKYLN